MDDLLQVQICCAFCTYSLIHSVRGRTLTETTRLARHHSNHLRELFYDKR